MKMQKSLYLMLLLTLAMLLPACRTSPSPGVGSTAPPPPELTQTSYLFEIVRHLYRWQLDDAEVERLVGAKHCVFWVRRLETRLDPGDRSELAEIILPLLNVAVKVKKADYTIEELNTVVKSQNFRITRVSRGNIPARAPRSCAVVEVDMDEMRDYLFRTRNQREHPDPAFLGRLRQALRQQAAKEGLLTTNVLAGDKIVHLAPLSPVANEIWAFWEAGRKLFYFASDIDLANPAVWQHQSLMAHIFDLDQQVVVSHEEAPGSNRFLTRYQVSRAIFNCVLLGDRLVLPPPGPATDDSAVKR